MHPKSPIIALKEYLGPASPWKNLGIIVYAGSINDPNVDDKLRKSIASVENYIQQSIPGINIKGMILSNINNIINDLEDTRKLLVNKTNKNTELAIKNAVKAMVYRMKKAQATMDAAADQPKENSDYPSAMPKVIDGQVAEVLQKNNPDDSQQIGYSEPQILPKGDQNIPPIVAKKMTLDDRIIELVKKF